MPLTAFVTDGNERPALAITRSLGRQGISVIVGSEQKGSLAGSSRYCRREVTYPSPALNARAFADALSEVLRAERVDAILPVTDLTTRIVAGRRDNLGTCRAAVPSLDAFETVTDKRRLVERARQHGIPVPRTHIVQGAAGLEAVIDRITYPAVVKASRSRVPEGDGWIPTGVTYASHAHELRRQYSDTPYLRHGVSIVQERVEGAGTGLFVLCDRGQIVTTFAHRRLREKPPSGGVSVLCESIPVAPELRAQAERLLTPLAWHGVAMLEYKESPRTGCPVLIEVNGRFWGSLQLAVDAGVDFPYLSWQLALGTPPRAPGHYATGVRSRWFFGDVDHLLARLRKGRCDLPADAPSTFRAIGEFLKSAAPGVRSEIPRRDDMRPAVHEALAYLRTNLRSLWSRNGTSAAARTANAVPLLQGGAHADLRD